VGAALGGAQTGFTLELGAGGALGRSNGHRVTHHDTQIGALDALSMRSGRDMKLLGAQASAKTIEMDVGRDLTIVSRQDTNVFRSTQTSAGIQASLCTPPFCYGQTVSGSAQASVQALRNDFASVNRQSGIHAGEGGYVVEVAGHTRLEGGVMASTAKAGRNALSTGTFDYSNIRNTGRYAGSMLGVQASGRAGRSTTDGVSSTESPKKVSATLGLPGSSVLGPAGFEATGTNSDTTETTYAAVSPGTLDVRGNTDVQGKTIGTQGDTLHSVAGLSRDPSHANGTVQDTFNARAVSDDLAVQRRSGQVGMQALGDLGSVLASRAGEAKAQAEVAYGSAHSAGDRDAAMQARANASSADRQLVLWGDDGVARIASHAATAALGAAMGHGNPLGAGGGAFAGDIVGHSASEAAQDLPGRTLLANLAAGAAGAATGAFLGQSSGMASGANGALSADLYNRQLHSGEAEKLAVLKRGRSTDEQQRLIDATCALTRCAAGVAANDPNWQRLVDSQSRGSRYVAEQDEIRATGAFDGYGTLDALNDWVDRHQISSRASGAVQGVTGAAGAASVFRAGCSTIALCGMAATAAATHLNYSKAGFRQFMYGERAPTYGERTLRSLEMNAD
jgi:filamentous hemagglutinin